MPAAWETLCKAKYEEENETEDPTVLEFIELQQENGITLATVKQVRNAVGAEREAWRLAAQAEAQSLKGNNTFSVVSKAELREVKFQGILPMKLVTGTKRDATAGTERKNVRAVVRGSFQRTSPNEELYTTNADITSVRAALAAAAPREFGVKVIDVQTAFLNAHLPDNFEAIYLRPPQALVDFGLAEPGTVWRVQQAFYGLRVSP